MRAYRLWVLAASAAAGTAVLIGCQSNTSSQNNMAQQSEVPELSNYPNRPGSAPQIDWRMEVFNANIGDTATATGGGGASQQR